MQHADERVSLKESLAMQSDQNLLIMLITLELKIPVKEFYVALNQTLTGNSKVASNQSQ